VEKECNIATIPADIKQFPQKNINISAVCPLVLVFRYMTSQARQPVEKATSEENV
jgi:hypothetical protein